MFKLSFKYAFLILPWLFFSEASFGQKYMYKVFADRENLNADFIFDIAVDKNSNLLLATEKGLVSFDGRNFETLSLDSSNTAISLTSIHLKRDTIWAASAGGKIYRKTKKGTDEFDFEGGSVQGFYVDTKEKSLLIFSKSKGLYKIGSNGQQAEKILDYPKGKLVRSFCQFDENHTFVGTNEGLYLLKRTQSGFKFEPIVPQFEYNNIIKVSLGVGGVWIATESEGVYDVDVFDINALDFSVNDDRPLANYQNVRLTDIFSDKQGGLWMTSRAGEVYRYFKGKTEKNTMANGLPGKAISKVVADPNGLLWFGTMGGGLCLRNFQPFKTLLRTDETTVMVNQTLIWKDMVVCATDNGIKFYHEKTQENIAFSEAPALNGLVNAIAVFDNKLVFSPKGEGLFALDQKGECTQLVGLPRLTKVNKLFAKGQNIYISTSAQGLLIYNAKEQTHIALDTKDGLAHNDIKHCLIDNANRIWIGTNSLSLSYIEEGKVHHGISQEVLKSTAISSIFQDRYGIVWIATAGQGLFQAEELLSEPTPKNYLDSQFTHIVASASDGNGQVWLATSKGVVGFNSRTKKQEVVFENDRNGFEFTVRQDGLTIANDRVLFLAEEGMYELDTTVDKKNFGNTPLQVDRIRVNDVAYFDFQDLELNAGKHQIEFVLRANCLHDPGSILYQWYLEGRETDWGSPMKDGLAFYPNLEEGAYVFHARSTNCNGEWQEARSMSIRIAVPIYKRPWFIILCILSTVSVVLLILRQKELRNRAAQKLLKRELDKRTAQLTIKNKELNAKSAEIKGSIRYAERIQRSMIVGEDLLEKSVEDQFIFFKPLDVVSGDFYWFSKVENKLVIVVADCTGHGIPGAMLSTVFIGILDRIVNERKLHCPSQILSELDQQANDLLSGESGEMSTDGMDGSVITIDLDTNEMIFAGGYNNAILFAGRQMQELKANKHHIGWNSDGEKNFEVTRTTLESGDRLYLYTDGYIDQFGGDKNKRLMRKNFKSLIKSHQELSLKEQGAFMTENFEDWRGNNAQVDDVLVVGFEIK